MRLLASSAPEATTPTPLSTGVLAHVWIEARHFFSRSDAQNRCWLWLLGADRRVRVWIMPSRLMNRDDVLTDLSVAPYSATHPALEDTTDLGDTRLVATFLRHAPVVPVPRWSVSWGHPVQRAIRAFAAWLDPDVLCALGNLEAPGPFFGSVLNYNQLVTLPEPMRTHRLQALAQFPPLVAPLLLSMTDRPDMFGDAHDSAARASLPRASDAVLDAIDRGRDLIGALAVRYRVDRALVRSPLCRAPWTRGTMPLAVLRMIAAMPAPARPRHRDEVEPRLACLDALPVAATRPDDVKHLAKAFVSGWTATWSRLDSLSGQLPSSLRNSRDFINAALSQATLPLELARLTAEQLGLAWIARRGLESLLRASRRWHERPLETLPVPVLDADQDSTPVELSGALEPIVLRTGTFRECLTEAALIEEGESMHHCVPDYWSACLTEGMRIVHLELPDGETSTAGYVLEGDAQEPVFSLEELCGPCNGEASEAMDQFAEEVLDLMNASERLDRRLRIARAAAEALSLTHGRPAPRQTIRRLDSRSRRELAQVLVWCSSQTDWQQQQSALFCGFVAGSQYADDADLPNRLDSGDLLDLVREPLNPHDPLAIKVMWQGHKLGYIPRAHNTEIARLLDRGGSVTTRVMSVDSGNGPWRRLEVIVMREALIDPLITEREKAVITQVPARDEQADAPEIRIVSPQPPE